MGVFEYDDILIQYDDTLSDYDGCIPVTSQFYRVVSEGKVDSSGYKRLVIEKITRPIDFTKQFTFNDGATPGPPPPVVPEQDQEAFYYRVSGVNVVPGTNYKQIFLEKIKYPITWEGE